MADGSAGGCGAGRQQHDQRAQALAAAGNDVLGHLVDQGHGALQARRMTESTAAMSAPTSARISSSVMKNPERRRPHPSSPGPPQWRRPPGRSNWLFGLEKLPPDRLTRGHPASRMRGLSHVLPLSARRATLNFQTGAHTCTRSSPRAANSIESRKERHVAHREARCGARCHGQFDQVLLIADGGDIRVGAPLLGQQGQRDGRSARQGRQGADRQVPAAQALHAHEEPPPAVHRGQDHRRSPQALMGS